MNRTLNSALFALACAAYLPQAAAIDQTTNTRFNPSVGVILGGLYTDYQRDPATYHLPGFILGGEAGLATAGISLGESELNFYANVDPTFYARLTASLTGDSQANVEEAFIQTIGLSHGFTIKAGRFYSAIGYENARHKHQWSFADAALPYRAMLNTRYGDDGVQVRWIAPTDTFMEFGGEMLRGNNYPAGGAIDNGRGAHTAFVHMGGDVGISNSWTFGLSRLWANALDRPNDVTWSGTDYTTGFTGQSTVSIADFVWKWAPNGNNYLRNFTFQSEYFNRDESGDVSTTVASTSTGASTYAGTQKGWYAQGVYQFMPRWRVGYRHDTVWADNQGNNATVLTHAGLLSNGYKPKRDSVMVDYAPSEFSRLRVQYNKDQSRPDITDNQWYFQYFVALGAHGAHTY